MIGDILRLHILIIVALTYLTQCSNLCTSVNEKKLHQQYETQNIVYYIVKSTMLVFLYT